MSSNVYKIYKFRPEHPILYRWGMNGTFSIYYLLFITVYGKIYIYIRIGGEYNVSHCETTDKASVEI